MRASVESVGPMTEGEKKVEREPASIHGRIVTAQQALAIEGGDCEGITTQPCGQQSPHGHCVACGAATERERPWCDDCE
jgi:hypothetical protein